jgi:hypothetical protein
MPIFHFYLPIDRKSVNRAMRDVGFQGGTRNLADRAVLHDTALGKTLFELSLSTFGAPKRQSKKVFL